MNVHVQFEPEAAQVRKHKRNMLASELLLRRLQRLHYDHAPEAFKLAHVPALYQPNPLLFGYKSYLKQEPTAAEEVAAGMKQAWDVLNTEAETAKAIAEPLLDGVSIRLIQRTVCRYFKIPYLEFISARRDNGVVRQRQLAMYLCKHMTIKSYPEIGRKFGGRDHTTVMHAIRRITELLLVDVKLATDMSFLMSRVAIAATESKKDAA